MASKRQQASAPSLIDQTELVEAVVSKLADRLGNGGTKLDTRLTEIAQCQQEMREDSIRVAGKLDEVSRVVGEIKPTLSTMTTRIHEVERNMGKPCPFHDMTVKQVEGLSELQKQHTATELKVAELSQKHSGLAEMQAAFGARMGADVSAIQSSIGAIRTEVGQLTTTVGALSATGSDTKDWVKYFIIALLTITFTILTNVVTNWVRGDDSHPTSTKTKTEAVVSATSK